MKKLKYLLIITFVLFLNFSFSQNEITKEDIETKSKIKIVTLNGHVENSGLGLFYILDLGENKSELLYTFIIAKKSLIKNATEIKLFFKNSDTTAIDNKIYEFKIPNNKKYIIEHPDSKKDLVVIPLGSLRVELEKVNVKIEPLFLVENLISYLDIEVTEKDILSMKEKIKKELGL